MAVVHLMTVTVIAVVASSERVSIPLPQQQCFLARGEGEEEGALQQPHHCPRPRSGGALTPSAARSPRRYS